MRRLIPVLLAGMPALFPGILHAQSDKALSPDTAGDKPEYRILSRYADNYHFMGRTDSVKAPYLSLILKYLHPSGFFGGGGLSVLTTGDAWRVDVVSLSAGYEKIGKRNALGISVREYFFNEESYVVQSEMSTYLNAYAGHDFSWFILYVDGSAGISEEVDVFTGLEVRRTFRPGHGNVRLVPSFLIQAGTQEYYSQYLSRRDTKHGGDHQGGTGPGMGMVQSSAVSGTTSSGKFELLDYETSLQASYTMHTMRFYLTGAWVVPVNPATIVTDQGTREESLQSGFFWTVAIRLTL